MIRMRQASDRDSNLLFAWRNDPDTQACSRSTAPVPREDHDRWMKFNVIHGYPEHIVLMADGNYRSVGVVRFDAVKGDLMAYDVSITVAPADRGNGLARPILTEACSYMHEYALNAEIRKDNIPSRQVFESCGFAEVGSDHHFVNYRREPL